MPGWGDPVAAEARAIGATCGGVRIWSLYVPNGRKVDDPHYVYKLDWLARLREAARAWRDDADARWSATGTSPRRTRTSSTWRRSRRTPTSPRRSGRRSRPSSTTGTSTSSARTRPGPEVYTYWDYYRQRFERNRGMRIDFVLGSPSLAARVTGAFIDRDERAGKGASDHAPVVVDLA